MKRSTFAHRVAQARRELGVAREEDVLPSDLARMLNVSPKTVYTWERGANLPSRAIMGELASVLGVTPAWLEFGQEPKHPERTVTTKPANSPTTVQTGRSARQAKDA